jgi:phosphohistidine phosphatase SixA
MKKFILSDMEKAKVMPLRFINLKRPTFKIGQGQAQIVLYVLKDSNDLIIASPYLRAQQMLKRLLLKIICKLR